VVSIETPDVAADLYTPIIAKIKTTPIVEVAVTKQ
jgi:hypothetical protein